MEHQIRKFAAAVRAGGLRISTAEVLDCLDQLPRIDLLDEAQFAATLRANFAKSPLDRRRFDHLYHLFFHELRHDLDAASTDLVEEVAHFRRTLTEGSSHDRSKEAVSQFIAGRPEAFLQVLHNPQSGKDLEQAEANRQRRGFAANADGLVRRLGLMGAIGATRQQLADYLSANQLQIQWETRNELKALVEQRLEVAFRLLAGGGPPVMEKDRKRAAATDLYGALGRKPFGNLSPGEMARLRDIIARLVRKLRDAAARRRRSNARGTVDMKRTLRATACTQGIPMELKFRRKPLRKGRIVVLCDLSGSVWSSVRFMLTMLYALQDCFDRVKSFAFIDEPVEVTRYFETQDIDQALAQVLDCPAIAYGAATDYGRMLRLFEQWHWGAVTPKTTVIVIGDGRSNYGNPEAGIVERIGSRCRRLIWLNPESEPFWYSGDSAMHAYEPFCNEVRPCQNLNQLATFVRDLVL